MYNNRRHKKIVEEISKELGIDKRVVHYIVSHSQLFTAKVIRGKNDLRAIRLPYFGVFTLMPGKVKK